MRVEIFDTPCCQFDNLYRGMERAILAMGREGVGNIQEDVPPHHGSAHLMP